MHSVCVLVIAATWVHLAGYHWRWSWSLTPRLTQSASFWRQFSQPITWLILTNKTVQENTQIKYNTKIKHKIQQNRTTLVQSTFMTLDQQTRWAYSTMLPWDMPSKDLVHLVLYLLRFSLLHLLCLCPTYKERTLSNSDGLFPVTSCGLHMSVNRLLATDICWLWTVHRCVDLLT